MLTIGCTPERQGSLCICVRPSPSPSTATAIAKLLLRDIHAEVQKGRSPLLLIPLYPGDADGLRLLRRFLTTLGTLRPEETLLVLDDPNAMRLYFHCTPHVVPV